MEMQQPMLNEYNRLTSAPMNGLQFGKWFVKSNERISNHPIKIAPQSMHRFIFSFVLFFSLDFHVFKTIIC